MSVVINHTRCSPLIIPSSGRSLGVIAADLLEHDRSSRANLFAWIELATLRFTQLAKFANNNLRASEQEIAGTLRSGK